jgi:capsular polysaccharide biosynthesis protein
MENEELDLTKVFDMFWNKKIEIIIIMLLFLVIGTVYTMFLVKPVYSSSTSLLLAGSQNAETTITTTDITINNKLISTSSKRFELIRLR